MADKFRSGGYQVWKTWYSVDYFQVNIGIRGPDYLIGHLCLIPVPEFFHRECLLIPHMVIDIHEFGVWTSHTVHIDSCEAPFHVD